MEALFIVLNDLTCYDELLELFVELDVRGATILESEGMAKALLKSEGLSSLLKNLFEVKPSNEIGKSKTIFTVLSKVKVSEVAEAVENLLKESESKIKGFLFSVPVNNVKSFK